MLPEIRGAGSLDAKNGADRGVLDAPGAGAAVPEAAVAEGWA